MQPCTHSAARSPGPFARLRDLEILGQQYQGHQAALEAARGRLGDDDGRVRLAAAKVLGGDEERDAIDGMLSRFDDLPREVRIAALERDEKEASAALADPALYQDFARAKPLIERQRAAKEELEGLYAAWEAAQQRLAAL